MQQTSVSWWLTVTLLRQILFSFPGLANLVYFFKGDCLQVLGFRNNLLHVLTGGKDYTHWWNKLYVCVYPGCITLLPRSLHVKICRDRVIISSGFQEKGGCPLIRACSVITSNTVYITPQNHKQSLRTTNIPSEKEPMPWKFLNLEFKWLPLKSLEFVCIIYN